MPRNLDSRYICSRGHWNEHHFSFPSSQFPLSFSELNAIKAAGWEAVADARQERYRQLEAQAEDRRLGQLLLDSAESLSVRTRNGGGSDSESSAATTSTTTKYGKKRFTLQGLEKQQQESLEHVKGQTELLAQQLGLQKEQMEQDVYKQTTY